MNKEDVNSIELYYEQLEKAIKVTNAMRESVKSRKEQESINKKI